VRFTSMAMSRADGKPGFAALRLVPGALLICLVSLRGLCLAQEVNAPAAGGGSGSVFAPSGWLELIAPVHDRIDLKFYGFYIGELEVPVAQFDLAVRTTKFLTITPSYMYYSAPASGLQKLAPRPGGYTDSFNEHQFRIDGTVTFHIRTLEMSVRGMYVRRFRPAPLETITRYRGRIMIAHPLAVGGHRWKPFASYETNYEADAGLNRDRLWAGVTLPLMKRVLFQPSYLFEMTDGTKDVHYLLFGLIVSTQ
jgi:Protein of unknown function (DUF2490)